MKWPWVSRAAYDAEQNRAEKSEVARLSAEAGARSWIQAYNDLMGKYHQLKLSGFTVPPVATPTLSTPDGRINRAIDSVPASRDPKNRARMWEQVRADRAAGVSDEEIVMRIQRGSRPAEEFA